jgi:hypothetical protein
MLKRATVKRATRCTRDGSGNAHIVPQSPHRSSIASVLGRTGRTSREAHCGHWRHSGPDALGSCDIDFRVMRGNESPACYRVADSSDNPDFAGDHAIRANRRHAHPLA